MRSPWEWFPAGVVDDRVTVWGYVYIALKFLTVALALFFWFTKQWYPAIILTLLTLSDAYMIYDEWKKQKTIFKRHGLEGVKRI